MIETLDARLREELDGLESNGTLKRFRTLGSPQGPVVQMHEHGAVVVLSSNDYLGLANHPEVVEAGVAGLRKYGAGTASARFICGTFSPHVELERSLASFVGTEAALTYVSCWNANEALIPSLTDETTVIFSDQLNHASIIDAVRLARAKRKVVYAHNDMDELQAALRSTDSGDRKLVVTDGVFSMEGDLAKLPEIIEVARQHDAIVIVDDSHGLGVMGRTGRGVAEHYGVLGEVDVFTGTLGKALGGAAGGFVASSAAVCEILAQRSRPQIFSNSLAPTVACSARRALDLIVEQPNLVARLHDNVRYFRNAVCELGYSPLTGPSAIVPIIVGETARAIRLSDRLLERGVFVTGFGFPVVPEGEARIRVQLSAAHTRDQIDVALTALAEIGRAEGFLPLRTSSRRRDSGDIADVALE